MTTPAELLPQVLDLVSTILRAYTSLRELGLEATVSLTKHEFEEIAEAALPVGSDREAIASIIESAWGSLVAADGLQFCSTYDDAWYGKFLT